MVFENRGRLIMAMLCALVVSGTITAIGYLIKPVTDKIFIEKDMTKLVLLPIVVIVVFAVRAVTMYGQDFFMSSVGERIVRRFRDALFDSIHDLPLSFFHNERTGRLMSRISNDVSIIKGMVSTAVTSVLRDYFTVVGLTVVIFYQNWRLALVALIVLPVAFYPVVELSRRVRRVSTGLQEAMADLSSFLHESFAGSKIVKAFGMEAYEKDQFHRRSQELYHLEMRAVIVRGLSSPVMEFFGGLGIAFILWYGGSGVIAGKSTPGTFVSFLTCVMLLYDPVKKLTQANNAVQQGLAAVDRIFDVIERTSEIQDPADPKPLGRGPHTVRFEDVWFGYDHTLPVLKEISLTVKQGEVLALVGMSGGGKTSLVNLIPRFYDVTQGAIRIDGIDIREVTVADLRREIAVVTQEPILFNDTVRNNIAYGRQTATQEEIEAAAKAAYAFDFISQFPKGFDTEIGELGNRLSGGEKQRMCIARALLKDAPILILDEATSSLDTEAEAVVQKALENLMSGRTTFVIAHRLSTVARADRIVVVVDGRIVEEGTHEALMARGGEYCKLYRMQFGSPEDAVAGAAALAEIEN